MSLGSVLGGPIGGLAGGFIGSVLGEIVVQSVADLSREKLQDSLRRFRPSRNADIERAILEALRGALQHSRDALRQQPGDATSLPRGLSTEEEALFKAWDSKLQAALKGADAQVHEAVGELSPDAPALAASPDETLADWLLRLLQRLAERETLPEPLREFLQARLPQRFRHEFAQLLKDPRHQRAWIAFQKQMLDAILQAIHEMQTLTPEIAQGVQLLQERQMQLTQAVAEWLESEPDRWQERAHELAQTITEPILHAIHDTRERVEFIVNLLGEKHRYRLLHEGTLRFLQSYAQGVFVGRQEILANLEAFLTTRSSGLAVIHAPAGYGKTRLMMKLLNRLQARGDADVAFHFFSTREELGGLGTRTEYAYAHLLLQLGHITNTKVYLPDGNPDELRAQLLYEIRDLKPPRGRVVLLIDALDEADAPVMHLPLPETLPDGVFVVVSARWDNRPEPPPYLEAWLARADAHYPLDALSESDLRDWVRNIEPLRACADDPDFIRQLHQRTEGLTLYARYLLDELSQSPNPKQALQNAPMGIQKYIEHQIRQLASHVSNAQGIRRMFALLTVVKAPLPQSDLETLCEVSVWDLQNLPQPVRRWFLCSKAGWQFAHPLLAIEFRNALGREPLLMEQKLIDYSARWKEHKSHYALRHYAAHLMERAQHESAAAEALYALATDDTFLQAQREAFPTEPDLPLKAIQQAIQVASQRDEAVILAHLMLRHAAIADEIRFAQSPYEIWSEKGDLHRALRVANLHNPRMRALHCLLLAAALSEPEHRKFIIRNLCDSNIPFYKRRWQERFIRIIEQIIGNEIQNECPELITKMLPNGQSPVQPPLPEESAQNTEGITQSVVDASDGYQQINKHLDDAQRFLHNHSLNDALNSLNRALKIVPEISFKLSSFWTKIVISIARAPSRRQKLKILNELVREAQQVPELEWQARILAAIAEARANIIFPRKDNQIFMQAFRCTSEIRDPLEKAWALRTVVNTVPRIRQVNLRKQVLQQAEEIATAMEDSEGKLEALRAILVVLAQIGEVNRAKNVLKRAKNVARVLQNPEEKENALIAIELALDDKFDDSLNIIQGLKDIYWKNLSLWTIATFFATQQKFSDAVFTIEQLYSDQHEVFPKIANDMLEAGDRRYFKQLLLPCAYFRVSALEMCAALIRAYPEQAEAIGEVVLEFVGAQGADTEAPEPAP